MTMTVYQVVSFNLQRCCRKCHHKTTLVCPARVGASGHSLLPVAGLWRLDRKEKALPALRSAPTPQIRENSHRRAIFAPANPFVRVFRSSWAVLWFVQARLVESDAQPPLKKVQSFGRCGAELREREGERVAFLKPPTQREMRGSL